MNKIKTIDEWLETAQPICTKTDGKTSYKFNNFAWPLKFASKIYRLDFTLQKARDNQQDLQIIINKLINEYNPTSKPKIKEKEDALKSANRLYTIRNEIIYAFSRGIFLYIDGFQVEKEADKETDEKTDEEMPTIMPELESKNLLNKEKINQ